MNGGGVEASHRTAQGAPLKNMREELDIITAYETVGTYRGAADICGTTHKTVKRVVLRHAAGQDRPVKVPRPANYESVRDLVADGVSTSKGRISAKRLLPRARAAGYTGSPRNFRRLVADEKKAWRAQHGRTHRPATWSPGEHLVIDWGVIAGVHVFAAVLAWSRFRFVRLAADEKATTTMSMLAECFEVLGGTPKVVLADRMGCLKGGVVANRVVPTPDYVRFATHYRFRPDFCEAADPESKGIVEALVRYGKDDLALPLILEHAGTGDLAVGAAAVLADLRAANQRVEQELVQARNETASRLADADRRAQAIVEEAKARATEEGNKIVAAARAEAEQQAIAAREALREQVAALAVKGAEQILRKEVNAGAHADLLSRLKTEL